jgi:hypothetical protein
MEMLLVASRRSVALILMVLASMLAGTPAHDAAAAGPLKAQSCTMEHRLRSLQGAVSTKIRFINRTAHAVHVYWLNYQGKRVLYQTLGPGQSYVQQTYLTHLWVVTTVNGRCRAIYRPTRAAASAVIRGF